MSCFESESLSSLSRFCFSCFARVRTRLLARGRVRRVRSERPDLDRFPGDQRALANRIVLSAHLHDLTESWESGAMPLAYFATWVKYPRV